MARGRGRGNYPISKSLSSPIDRPENVVAVVDLHSGLRRFQSHRAETERCGKPEFARGRPQFLGTEQRRNGVPIAECLADTGQIGRHAQNTVGTFRMHPKAVSHIVEDQQGLRLASHLFDRRNELAVGLDRVTTGALVERIEQDRGKIIAVLVGGPLSPRASFQPTLTTSERLCSGTPAPIGTSSGAKPWYALVNWTIFERPVAARATRQPRATMSDPFLPTTTQVASAVRSTSRSENSTSAGGYREVLSAIAACFDAAASTSGW